MRDTEKSLLFTNLTAKNQEFSKFDHTIICVENKCIIIEGVNNSTILEILQKTKSEIRNAKESFNEESTQFCSHKLIKNDYNNNFLVKSTLFAISNFLIQRFFCPSFYFEDRSFLSNEKDKNLEQIFHEKFNNLFESKGPNEMNIDDIIGIFNEKYNNQSQLKSFQEEDFIKLKQIPVKKNLDKSEITYHMVIHLESLHIFLMKKFGSGTLSEYQEREVEFCSNYSQRCFIKCYGLLKNKTETIGLIYEYMCNGSLQEFIQRGKGSLLHSFMIMNRIFQAIKYLNANKLIHRDLKPSNILLNNDFVPYISDNETVREFDEKNVYTQDLGSQSYMSPEQYKGKFISYPSDIFSFGLIIYYLFEHETLCTGYDQYESILNSTKFPKIRNCTEGIQKIFESCCKIDQNKRIKSDEIEEIIINEIISNHFENYFINEKCKEKIELEIEKYLFENLLTLSQNNYSFYELKKYFCHNYYIFCNKLTEINKYKQIGYNNLGNMYYCGIYVVKSYSEAKKYYEAASDLQYSASLNNLGNMYKLGNGIEQNYLEAEKCYLKAAEQNNSNALYNLGYLYFNGYGVEKNLEKAEEYFKKSADLNNTHGLNALGYLYTLSDFHKNGKSDEYYKKAIECYEKGIKLGNVNSYLNLMYLYIEGLGVPKDLFKAADLCKLAADKNSHKAILYLGRLYKKGIGVEQDLIKSKELFEKAANLGNVEAYHLLGNLYFHGKGVEIDYEKARNCYIIAAKNSDRSSLYKLGIIYEKGLGVEKDILLAKKYYKFAAKRGYYSAYIVLANIYYNGEYFDVNDEKAIKYYKKNMLTNGEIISFEQNGFYRMRKNFGYYPSHNDIGLIYWFRNDIENAITYLKKAYLSEYQFAQNAYGLLYDPSITKNKKICEYDDFNKSEDEKYIIAKKIYEKASKESSFSLAEFNLAHMLEKRNEIKEAINYYELASEHENNAFVYHLKKRYDKRLNMSISFIILFTDCKLFLLFSKSNLKKSKRYFIKIITKLQNEKENDIFAHIKDALLKPIFLSGQIKPKNIIDETIKENCSKVKYQVNNNENLKSINKSIRITKFLNDPEQFFILIKNEPYKTLFMQRIEYIVYLMEDIIYTPPYYIIFGRIIISNNPKLKIMIKQKINKDFYDGFGLKF